MKLKRLGAFVALLSLLVSMVAGCQPQFQPGTYIDDMGRTVSIDEIPQRLVSFGPSITETLFALGLGERVVGVSNYCNYPEAAELKPKIGDAFSPSIEKIIELEPDLVLTVKQEQLNSQLDALGIKFMVLDPRDIDGIFKDIELLGKVTGIEGRAKKLINDMNKRMSDVVSLVEDASRVRVFYIIDATDLTLPWTAGPGSSVDALITMAGGENTAGQAQGAWVKFSIEAIVDSDPEVIILPAKHGTAFTPPEVLKEHPAWRRITAVKLDRIYTIDGDLVDRSGPRIIQGLEEMAKIIHPELFE